jgi:antitoxin (DNA-binding transcriptional repressor) of toxin-antitoxin stability system
MERVSIKELQKRLSFWLKNLPVEITSHGETVAIIITPGAAEETVPTTQGEKAAVVGALNAQIAAIMDKSKAKVDTNTGEITEPEEEKRIYTDYSDTEKGEQEITVTAALLKKKLRAGWKQAWGHCKPITKGKAE